MMLIVYVCCLSVQFDVHDCPDLLLDFSKDKFEITGFDFRLVLGFLISNWFYYENNYTSGIKVLLLFL